MASSGLEGFGKAAKGWFTQNEAKLDRALQEVAKEVAEAGTNSVRKTISTSGTKLSGKAGRIETGEMIDSVSGKSESRGKGKARAEFGWLSKTPFWALYQEHGFVHYITKNKIEGMYALDKASLQLEPLVKDLLEEKISGI